MGTLVRLIRRLKQDPGQALIEYILVLPMVFLLIVNCVNFGGFFYAWITVTNAARAGADSMIMSVASVAGTGTAGPSTATAVYNTITSDVSSLPNKASLVVNICQSIAPAVVLAGSTCTSIPADPEPTSYVLTSVDVTYTYRPFIAVFSFPKLGVNLTLPQTTIRKVAVMRNIQ
jgi:Flp pilus assembly protein TadG